MFLLLVRKPETQHLDTDDIGNLFGAKGVTVKRKAQPFIEPAMFTYIKQNPPILKGIHARFKKIDPVIANGMTSTQFVKKLSQAMPEMLVPFLVKDAKAPAQIAILAQKFRKYGPKQKDGLDLEDYLQQTDADDMEGFEKFV